MIGYLFVGGMMGFIVTWVAYDVVDTEELNFVIFENDAELQEICWSGLRHTKSEALVYESGDAFSEAWSIMKGIVFNGVEYEDIDELDPMIVESLRLLTEEGQALPPPPFKPTRAQRRGSIGRREGTPLMAMRNAVLAGQDPQPIFDAMRGFTDSENNMLTTFINWEGGKTSEMPKFRVMASS